MISKIIQALLLKMKWGTKVAFLSLSTESALDRCKSFGIKFKTVIDVGASDGRWSINTRKIFPDAKYFLIEAQEEHYSKLEANKKKHHNLDFVISAAGDSKGEIYFDKEDLFGGVVSKTVKTSFVKIPVDTIDNLITLKNLSGPFLLKLDTHGYEIPIFDGAEAVLRNTSLIVVETYNFKITKDSLRFHEMCSYLEGKGFRCVDISEPMFRKKDGAFWQIDLFFIPQNSSVFESNEYE